MTKPKKTQAPFKQVVADLLDNSKPFSPTYLHRFSDIDPADLAALRIAWLQVNPERRFTLLQDLEDLTDTDTLVSFDDLARFTLVDPDARVRAIAIRLLWETNDEKLIPIFIKMMQSDPDELVRAGAAGGLGLFIYLGELEEIQTAMHKKVEDGLLSLVHGTDKPIVRRRAVEALGYSSNDEVPAILEKSYASTDKDWQASALFAMGRSADERWEKKILAKLDSPELDVQLEAVRAAGELELQKSRKPLLDLLKNPEELDVDLRSAAIWSISQIGGKGVRERLEKLAETTEDEDETYIIDEALDNLDFKEGVGGLGILDMTPVIDEEHTRIVDLSGDEEEEEEEEEEEDDDFLYGTKN
jgi:HEAT repeat protein